MNNKLTKEQLLTALMIKLDQIEYKIETLQSEFKVFMESHETIQGPAKPFLNLNSAVFNCQNVTPHCIDGTGPCKCSSPMSIQDSEEFDGAYK